MAVARFADRVLAGATRTSMRCVNPTDLAAPRPPLIVRVGWHCALIAVAAASSGCNAINPCVDAGGDCVLLTSTCLGGVPSTLSCEIDSSTELCCLPRVPPSEATLECQ